MCLQQLILIDSVARPVKFAKGPHFQIILPAKINPILFLYDIMCSVRVKQMHFLQIFVKNWKNFKTVFWRPHCLYLLLRKVQLKVNIVKLFQFSTRWSFQGLLENLLESKNMDKCIFWLLIVNNSKAIQNRVEVF